MAEEIFVGNVAVGVIPRATGFSEEIRSQLVPAASSIGEEWGQKASEGISSGLGDFMGRWGESQSTQARTAGAQAGGNYGAAFRDKIDEILREIPPVDVTANTVEAAEAVGKLRAELEELRSKEIGVDMTNSEAMAKIEEIKAGLDDLRSKNVVIDASNSEALGKVDELKAGLDSISGKTIPITANIAEASAKVDELKAMAAEPVIVPVELKTAGGGVSGETKAVAGAEAAAGAETAVGTDVAAGIEREMATAGEEGAQGFGAKFMNTVSGLIGSGSKGVQEIGSGITEDFTKMGEESGHEFGGAFSGVLSILSKVGLPTAVAGAAVAVLSVIGEKLDTQQKQLEAALRNGGQNWDEWSAKVTAAGNQMSKYGYTQDQVDATIRQVYQVTGNMNEALGAQAEIANIAANRHISLTAATKQYDQALSGNARTLRQLGVIQATGTTEAQAMTSAQEMLASQVKEAGGMAQFAAQHHLSLQAAQKLATEAARGQISAFNSLGIEVLPRSASAAQNYSQVQAVLNSRLGGQAAAQAETFGGRINALRAQFMNAAEQLGMKLLPYMESFMSWLTKTLPHIESFIGALAKIASPVISTFFRGLATEIDAIGKAFTFLTTGPMRIVTGIVTGIVAAFTLYVTWGRILAAVNALIETTTPFGWVVIAVTALTLLIGVIVRFHSQIVAVFVNGWHVVENAVRATWSFITGIFSSSLNWVERAWSNSWNAVKNFIAVIWRDIENGIKTFFNTVANVFGSSLDWVKRAWDNAWGAVKNAAKEVWDWIVNTLSSSVRGWENILDSALELIKRAWDNAWGWVKNVGKAAWDWIKDQISAEGRGWENIFDSTLEFVKRAWDNAWGWIKNIGKAAWDWIHNAIDSEGHGWEIIFDNTLDFLKRSWDNAWGWIKNVGHAAWEWIKDALQQEGHGWEIIFDDTLNFFKRAWDNAWGWIKNLGHEIWELIKTGLQQEGRGWEIIFDDSLNLIKKAWNDAWGWVKNIAVNIWHDITGAANTFWHVLKSGFQDAVNAVKSIWGTIENAFKAPVKFIIDTVYNNGIVRVIDAITGLIHVSGPKPISGWAKGGVLPGYSPGVDNMLVPLSGGEGILTPEAVTGIGGPSAIDMLNRMYAGYRGGGYGSTSYGFQTGGTQPIVTTSGAIVNPTAGGAGGITSQNNTLNTSSQANPVGWLWDHTGKAVEKTVSNVKGLIGSVASKALGALRELVGDSLGAAINVLVNPLINKIPGVDTPVGSWIKSLITNWEKQLVNWIIGTTQPAPVDGAIGGGSGADVAAYAKSFATGHGHPYVTGGAGPNGWDCSGFSAYVYNHFGYFPGKQGVRYGTSETQYVDSHVQKSGPETGALVFFDDHFYPPPGHVGIVLTPNSYVSAYDHAEGTVIKPIGNAMGYRIPKGGFHSATVPGGGSVAGAVNGSEMQNGIELYQYLKSALFSGHKIAAAGATASIWGESNWNPFAVGTGGRGLIGWTPPSTISDAAFKGGMATQMPQIIVFVNRSGDGGVISQMLNAASVSDAAWEWGRGVERFGIPDVHSTGIALATQIMNKYAQGGRPSNEWGIVGEEGPELVYFGPGSEVLSHSQSVHALVTGAIPGARSWAAGSTSYAPGELQAIGNNSNIKSLEKRLDTLINATRSVGNDVGRNISTTGRIAAHRTAFGG